MSEIKKLNNRYKDYYAQEVDYYYLEKKHEAKQNKISKFILFLILSSMALMLFFIYIYNTENFLLLTRQDMDNLAVMFLIFFFFSSIIFVYFEEFYTRKTKKELEKLVKLKQEKIIKDKDLDDYIKELSEMSSIEVDKLNKSMLKDLIKLEKTKKEKGCTNTELLELNSSVLRPKLMVNE